MSVPVSSTADLVAFARAMVQAADWSAERAVDFFATPDLWTREFDAWMILGRPQQDDPGWDEFCDLVLSPPRLRRFLWERF